MEDSEIKQEPPSPTFPCEGINDGDELVTENSRTIHLIESEVGDVTYSEDVYYVMMDENAIEAEDQTSKVNFLKVIASLISTCIILNCTFSDSGS